MTINDQVSLWIIEDLECRSDLYDEIHNLYWRYRDWVDKYFPESEYASMFEWVKIVEAETSMVAVCILNGDVVFRDVAA